MADTTTLQPAQQKRERVNQTDFLGGTFENLENIFGTITGRGPGYVNEGPVRGADLENLSKMPELKAGSGFPSSGEITGFQIPNELIRRKQIVAELAAAHSQTINQAPVEAKREKINTLNVLQNSYTGSVDSEGNVTEYHDANATRKDAENLALRLQDERWQKLQQARGKVKSPFVGENGLLMGGERSGGGHWSTTPG